MQQRSAVNLTGLLFGRLWVLCNALVGTGRGFLEVAAQIKVILAAEVFYLRS